MKFPLFLCSLLFLVPAVAAEWAKVRNADNAIVALVKHPADWSPEQVAHKYGPTFDFRFIAITQAPRPVLDENVFQLTRTVTVLQTNVLRSFATNRYSTNQIVKHIKAEAQRRVDAIITTQDALTLVGAVVEVHDHQLDSVAFEPQSGLSNADKTTLADARAIWDRCKAIRQHAKTLIAQAESLTTIMEGWPE